MALPLYLALTPAEMAGNPLPENLAYMACHFSPGGTGLSNVPDRLPTGAMLILDDSNPMDGHDPERILAQLSAMVEQHGCESILLDFQRPGISQQQDFAHLLACSLPCPVGVSELYAVDLSTPVFLNPVPPDVPLAEYLAPWQGREIWLDAALDGTILTLTAEGCTAAPLLGFPEDGLSDEKLHCHYTIETGENCVAFRLWRTRQDLDVLLLEAQSLGIAKAIGLWQELNR